MAYSFIQSVSQSVTRSPLFLQCPTPTCAGSCSSKYSTLLPESASGGADGTPGPTRHRHTYSSPPYSARLGICLAHPRPQLQIPLPTPQHHRSTQQSRAEKSRTEPKPKQSKPRAASGRNPRRKGSQRKQRKAHATFQSPPNSLAFRSLLPFPHTSSSSSSASLPRPPLRSRIAPGPTSPARVRAGGGHDAAARGVGAGARLAGGAAGHALLPRLRRAPGVPAQRVQHVLPRLHGRAAAAAAGLLLLLPRAPTLVAPRHPGIPAVVVRGRRGRVSSSSSSSPLPSPPLPSLPYSVDWQCGRPAAREPAS
jgi:hypothetical protein